MYVCGLQPSIFWRCSGEKEWEKTSMECSSPCYLVWIHTTPCTIICIRYKLAIHMLLMCTYSTYCTYKYSRYLYDDAQNFQSTLSCIDLVFTFLYYRSISACGHGVPRLCRPNCVHGIAKHGDTGGCAGTRIGGVNSAITLWASLHPIYYLVTTDMHSNSRVKYILYDVHSNSLNWCVPLSMLGTCGLRSAFFETTRHFIPYLKKGRIASSPLR